ncbi:enoyl-CoA hydratase/isomerase family protein [Streptomyces sp. C11-1]|uniref:Enoyl-CoA hydratase/isomerase family protein n=1 Tax=Streptomyces durocortorensis TaxID=2811104 RepID=A0ABY9W1H4_9ACTN|nr:enoyl-CoA hydratase/isomerase family protein [Streptomyces durocortorensis]WNF29663.1 enoyl-CoA hydratase/isomerase family protein [Streptomyces durocortorensis]
MSAAPTPGTADTSPGLPAVPQDAFFPLRLTYDGPLAVLTMDSPPANTFDAAMWRGWAQAMRWLTEHPPRALLVRAGGRIVSAGVDVQVFADLDPDTAEEFWHGQLRITQALEKLPCPTVFAAHSLTLTAAFELALACDLIVATASARFGLVERKVGFTPSMGGTQRLAERAGPGRARELVMTGDLYRGATLADWGVVNALFKPATFHADAHAYALRLANGPTVAHSATKQVVRAYLDGGVEAADGLLPAVAGRVARSSDHARAVAAFLADGPEHATTYAGE